jgi:hypothetical protein
VLIVVGDVTGKGLQAGMLVALLVGAIRSTVETNFDPLFVLEALNRRLLGRGQAHATCLALHIIANGVGNGRQQILLYERGAGQADVVGFISLRSWHHQN